MTTTITIPAHKVAAVEAALFRAGRKTFTVGHYSDGWHATPNNTNQHKWFGDTIFSSREDAVSAGTSCGWEEVDEDGRAKARTFRDIR